ncbi:MAG: Uma2 family endonuclease [Capsulimonadaceae bacterium]
MAVLENPIRQEAVAVPEYRRRLWTTEEYYKMAEAGILDPHERVELIDGEVIQSAPVGPEHSFISNKMYRGLLGLGDTLGKDFSVFHETPITLAPGIEPQPDLIIARGPMEKYRQSHPGPADLCLVVDVCASTLASDRKRKLPLYAQFAIPEVWIVNLVDRQVEVFRDPSETHYDATTICVTNDSIELSFAPGKVVPVADILQST